ncbi:hypothetical protein GCM10011379_49770 [Filimonas zeae]|uniref:Uncharacterized protein n=1 Tax=Filimonas zeae TaxID=1737353 RepID=A0A917J5J1_9BACT|nr:hypothetical protein GCM10011379_49770 [Filimonas zeae]
MGNEAVKGGDEVVFKAKPMGDFFSIEVVVTPQTTLFQKEHMPAGFTFSYQKFITWKRYLLKTFLKCYLRFAAQVIKVFKMGEQLIHK